MRQLKTELVSQKEIAASIYEAVVFHKEIDESFQPGQFVHVKAGFGSDPLLRRPISICRIDPKKHELTMIYRAEGKGTKVLSEMVPGVEVDLLGPLGKGFPVDKTMEGDTALLVGGGIGVPPLYYLSQELTKRGVNVKHINGFQTSSVVFYEEKFKALGPVTITTADGTYGEAGFVTNQLDMEADYLFACGPSPMLKALENYHAKKGVYLSLEQRMGCGIGACLACVCHVQGDETGFAYRKVCSDGPVFQAGEVVL
ncbi:MULTISPECIES: dihydroorotate dehydrogenase electron transfer subunit [Bacillaceae]|uniref:dihydroorotate dehydrogenase electron transfer subunit n=1 Tax=Bacillales TaxID=1385 RepID=UPI0018848DDC|nr:MULTISPECIES: dihydroorotate dehydrogenase electron transfer subunit [Bacillaceae]MBF0708381.1 dihydroorotate dehydrogenase electron transfer subunit [Pseudalkalibacillus hwajinpoensis]MDO6655571.1 dihydroorotate dehydrogenase electron transfer subunit [Anaerobacillus sp. 1_MG-2023]